MASRARKVLLWVVIGAAAVIASVLLLGALLPEEHTATVEARYAASAEEVFATIADVRSAPSWRHDLQRVELLSRSGEPFRWREVSDWGTLTFVREVHEPPHRLVSRIVDEGQGFGGTWTYELTEAADTTTLRITERGVVSNPFYRFMSRFVMGYHAGMESYARDLGARLRQPGITPVRL